MRPQKAIEMFDPTFGSHFVQSAIDLAILAEAAAKPVGRDVQVNKLEAIRLYQAAIRDAELARKDLQQNRLELHRTGRDIDGLIQAVRARIDTWQQLIYQLQD